MSDVLHSVQFTLFKIFKAIHLPYVLKSVLGCLSLGLAGIGKTTRNEPIDYFLSREKQGRGNHI